MLLSLLHTVYNYYSTFLQPGLENLLSAGPCSEKMWGPLPGAADPIFPELATCFCSSLSFTRESPIILGMQKCAAVFVGPLFGQTCWTCLNLPLCPANYSMFFDYWWLNELSERCCYLLHIGRHGASKRTERPEHITAWVSESSFQGQRENSRLHSRTLLWVTIDLNVTNLLFFVYICS